MDVVSIACARSRMDPPDAVSDDAYPGGSGSGGILS
jgi:hypothetical protein